MKRFIFPALIVLAVSILTITIAPAASNATKTDRVWQLVDFQEKAILQKLGITDQTSKQIGINIMQNALSRHKDPAVRAACAKILGRFEAKAAAAALTWALKDPNAEVRQWSAAALGIIKERRAIVQLTQLLKKDPAWQSRRAIVNALKNIGDRRAGPAVAECLVTDPHFRVRAEAPGALLALKDKRGAKQLLQALSDPHENVRAEAALVLGDFEYGGALVKLIELLKDKSATVRKNTVIALAKLDNRKAVEPLIATLGDENYVVRVQAASALGVLGRSKAIKPLQQVVKDDPEPKVRTAAQAAIEKIKNR